MLAKPTWYVLLMIWRDWFYGIKQIKLYVQEYIARIYFSVFGTISFLAVSFKLPEPITRNSLILVYRHLMRVLDGLAIADI